MEQFFTTAFFILLFVKLAIELYLSQRNQNHVKQHQDAVPKPFEGKISLEEHQKAARYTIRKSRFGQITNIIGVGALLVWLPLGLLNTFDTWVRANFEGELTRGLVLFGLFFLVNLIIGIPEKLYSTFVIEEEFGFNKMTPKIFLVDMLKQLILTILIGAPFLYVMLLILEKLGNFWWVYAWSFMIGFQFLMILIYPNFIAPLFNKFSPLDSGSLKEKIEALLDKIGFAHSGIFIMDASKRSSHGNAYFTGFGKTKRIVFFDNLLKSLSDEEVEAVLAHELGHFKHKHIMKMLTISIVSALIGFYILGLCYKSPEFFTGHFISETSSYMALLLFSLVSGLYTFFLTPFFSMFSRKHEYEADSFAAKHSNAQMLISALVSLYKENASTLTPDPLFSKIYHSHPPAMDRIKHLEAQGSLA